MATAVIDDDFLVGGASAGGGLAGDDSFVSVRKALQGIAEESLRVLWPTDVSAAMFPTTGKYSPHLHAQICRMKFLGLGDAAAAKAVRIAPETLRSWKVKFPRLAADMDTASELSNAHAATLLREMMNGGGPTAFQAVKFFLSTHSPDFQEKQRIEVDVSTDSMVRAIRTRLYGLPDAAVAAAGSDATAGADTDGDSAGVPELAGVPSGVCPPLELDL
jgi:hypothetical protein